MNYDGVVFNDRVYVMLTNFVLHATRFSLEYRLNVSLFFSIKHMKLKSSMKHNTQGQIALIGQEGGAIFFLVRISFVL